MNLSSIHKSLRLTPLTLLAASLLPVSLIPPFPVCADEASISVVAAGNPDTTIASQAIDIPASRLVDIMKNIHYVRDGAFSSKNEQPVFENAQMPGMARKIRQMLHRIHNGEAVSYRSKGLRGMVHFSHGALYWHLQEINHRPSYRIYYLSGSGEDEPVNPDDRIEEHYWHLTPQTGQSLFKERPDWIITPVSPALKASHDEITQIRETRQAPGRKAGDILTRILKTRRLLGRDFITRKEYDEKVSSLIAEYESTHPSIEDRMALLHSLWKKRYIDDAAYQRGKKRLLDSL